MRRISVILAAAGFLSAAALAQDAAKVALHPGEQVTLKVAADGQVTRLDGGAARPMTQRDLEALAAILTHYSQAMGPNAGAVVGKSPPPPLQPDVVRISFVAAPDPNGREGRMLVVENGYGAMLKYRAAIVRNNLTQPTDVCTVLPHLADYEHWPYPIAEIDLSDLTLLPARPGQAPVCE